MDIDALYQETIGHFRVDLHRMMIFNRDLERERRYNRNINIITDEYEELFNTYEENIEISKERIETIQLSTMNEVQKEEYVIRLEEWKDMFDNIWEEIYNNYEWFKKKQAKYHARSLKNRTGHYKNKNKNKNKNKKTRRNIRNILPVLNRSNVFSRYL
jgi:hypothetical protein